MSFDRNVFREGLLQDQSIDSLLKAALRAAWNEGSTVNGWLGQMFAELERLLREPAHPPIMKLSALKVQIMFMEFSVLLLLLGDVKICREFERKVYSYVRNLAQYDRQASLDRKGQDLFKNHAMYVSGSPQQKEEIKRMGNEYVRICLESMPVWAGWLPNDLSDESQPSLFVKGYQALQNSGIQFPQSNFKFYSKNNVERMEERVKRLTDEVMQEEDLTSFVTDQDSRSDIRKNRSSIIRIRSSLEQHANKQNSSERVLDSYMRSEGFVSLTNNLANGLHNKKQPNGNDMRSQQDRELINEVEQLKKQLSLKMVELTSQRDAKVSFVNRIRQMEKRQAELVRTIDSQKAIIATKSRGDEGSRQMDELRAQLQKCIADNQSLLVEIKQLRSTVSSLTHDNQALLAQIERLKSMTNQPNSKSSQNKTGSPLSPISNGGQLEVLQQKLKKLQSENRELKFNLLSECIESVEFNQEDLRRKRESRIRFEEYFPDELFEPYYSNLTTEEQVRFRKTLLKPRELLMRESNIEIGCVTQLLASNRLKIGVFITNVGKDPIREVQGQLHCEAGISIIKGNERPLNTLAASYQEKISYILEAASENFGSAAFTLKYCVEGEVVSKQLLLPFSKVKLTQPRPYLADNELQCSKERTVELDCRLMQSLSKLSEYFELVYERTEAGNTHYYLQFRYLKDKYEMSWSQLGRYVHLSIRFLEDCSEQAERLLDEWAFILGKEPIDVRTRGV